MLLTWLYVPGDRPERFAKAVASGADAVIIDLEDAVTLPRKAFARSATAEFLASDPGIPVIVRVNEIGSLDYFADLSALVQAPGVAGLRLPKVDSPAQVTRTASLTGKPLHCLIESAAGVEACSAIASASQAVAAIGLGEADLRSDLGVTDDSGLLYARSRIVIAARAAGLPPPVMSVYSNLSDLDGLREDCATARRLGFVGRAALHPNQLSAIVDGFRPSPREVSRSAELLSAVADATENESGTTVLPDGRFADRAMIALAQRTVDLAARCG
jgi:citrate lyase subunit beta/citryl-CoA lyase